MNLSRRTLIGRGSLLVASSVVSGPGRILADVGGLNVRTGGAKGDGKTRDTAAIQAVIDAAGRSGGTVVFPPGEYLSGTLRLRDRVTLRLDAGAALIASPDDDDFDPHDPRASDALTDRETSDFSFALLRGHGLERVSIVGPGRIDGNRSNRGGPKPIALEQCRGITIRDLTMENAGNYNVSLLGCDDVRILGVTIRNGYADGIDPDSCRNVRIAGCQVESRDDAICAKASGLPGGRRAMENLVVTDCTFVSVRNALKLGTESVGHFRNIVFRDCTITGRKELPLYPREWKPQPSAGISLTNVDGGTLEDVVVSGITMTGVRVPIFVRLGNRRRDRQAGRIRNVSIANVAANGARSPSSITGILRGSISNISLRDVRIVTSGGGSDETMTRAVPERESDYPDASRLRDLPASGLYCRHVTGLSLARVDLTVAEPDPRPALTLDDVREATLRTVTASAPTEGRPVVWLRSVQGCVLDGIRSRATATALIRVSGAGTERLVVVEDRTSKPGHVVMLDADVKPTALRKTAPR